MDSHSFHPDGSLMVPVILLAIPQTKPPTTKPKPAIPPREAMGPTTYLAARQSLLTMATAFLLTTLVDSLRGLCFEFDFAERDLVVQHRERFDVLTALMS
jgi:hypothetical protein